MHTLSSGKKGRITRLFSGTWRIALVMTVVFLIILLFLEFPGWLVDHTLTPEALKKLNAVDRLKAENDIRSTTLQLIAGLFFLVTAYFTWQQILNSRKQTEITRQGQITERFTRAVAQLGDDNLDVRLGGIYALERLARNSEEDIETINQILTAYVRGHSTASTKPSIPPNQPALRIRAADLQAVMTILVGPDTYNVDPSELNLERINVSSADLRYAQAREVRLNGAQLSYVDFDFANLQGIDLAAADLRGAKMLGTDLSAVHHSEVYRSGKSLRERSWIVMAKLTKAILSNAELRGANLQSADLAGAVLNGADLQAVNLQQTTLRDADLSGANLSYAKGNFTNFLRANLTKANLGKAKLFEANLEGANLKGANLHETDLRGAKLDDADFHETVLSTATLKGARANGGTRWPDDFNPRAAGVILSEGEEYEDNTEPLLESQNPETYDTSRYDVLREPVPWPKRIDSSSDTNID